MNQMNNRVHYLKKMINVTTSSFGKLNMLVVYASYHNLFKSKVNAKSYLRKK
jgi:hypothetical protein